jgi:DNA-binding CsgD family transcriptional regulator
MDSLRTGDYSLVLDLIAGALQHAAVRFPDVAVTDSLRATFQADFAGAGRIDFKGADSRRWADSPDPVPPYADKFHDNAIKHPVALAHFRTGDPKPLRLSDIQAARAPSPAPISRMMAIPLAITRRYVCGIAVMRGSTDFGDRELRLAGELQPVFSAIYMLRDRLAAHDAPRDPDTGINVSLRELAVLDLMADGLIAAAIARRLGISQHTVRRHMESIYRKLGTHDRASTVLRGQALGLLGERTTRQKSG